MRVDTSRIRKFLPLTIILSVSLVLALSFFRYLYLVFLRKDTSILFILAGVGLIIVSSYILNYRINSVPSIASSYGKKKYIERGCKEMGEINLDGKKFVIFKETRSGNRISNILILFSSLVNISYIILTYHHFDILFGNGKILETISLFGSVKSVGFTFCFFLMIIITYIILDEARFFSFHKTQKIREKAHKKWEEDSN